MSFSSSVLQWPRPVKRSAALCVDAALCVVAVGLAFALRLEGWAFPAGTQWFAYFGSLVFALPLFISFGLYRAIFRYAGWHALMTVVQACAIYALIYSFVFTGVGVTGVPRSIGLLQPILLLLGIGGSRAIARYMLGGGYKALLRQAHRSRVLIYGAGSAGRQLAAAIANGGEMALVGYVDDDQAMHGSVLNGVRIHPGHDLPSLVKLLRVDNLLLAIPSAPRQKRNEIVERLRGTSIAVRTLPGFMDIAHGRVTMQDLRELGLDELLGRTTVPPNTDLLSSKIKGKTVLVSGAGGSIGSELCRQILDLQPKILILLEVSEFNLYSIELELARRNEQFGDLGVNLIAKLGSVQDQELVRAIFEQWRPETVYHAAAYKHVPLVELNPTEGLRNNVFGTLCLARTALMTGVRDFVLISTDKAVRPTNVMGASKRIAELILQALAAEDSNTVFSMVRFGNVLGSSGSVVPLFRQQIRSGKSVTVTHKDITRYFMTIPEAAQLVIQAGSMAKGGEVFVLDMGEPVKIADLARRMIELSGLTVQDDENPDGDIAIEYVGLRPGEKLFEELLIGDNPEATSHDRILKARDEFRPWAEIEPIVEELLTDASDSDEISLRIAIKSIVPEYNPTVSFTS